MKIDVLTLFPEMFDCLKSSMTGRAFESNIIQFRAVDVRDFTADKHRRCDDAPFGGGAGMVMTPQPVYDALQFVDGNRTARRVFLSPHGKTLTSEKLKELSEIGHLVLLCGHYEGVDQRIIDNYVDEEISIGDYVLTGGELPAMVLIDGLARHIPGVLGNENSAAEESFSEGLLEYPQYTRPQVFNGFEVPEILISGHHNNIAKWRKQQQLEKTKARRPDLLQ